MDARSITSLARLALSAATREELRRHTLQSLQSLRGRVVGMMQLGRARGFGFTQREADRLHELVPILALAEATHAAIAPSERSAQLSPRESEVLRHLTFAGVSTRAELVAWSLGALR